MPPQPVLSPAALVLVDVSPRWLYGHTIADDIDPAFRTWTMALALLVGRLNAVTRYLEDQNPAIPIVTVELNTLHWLRTPAHPMPLALAGLYGDACVKQAAQQLQRRGHAVTVVSDLCVWEEFAGLGYPAPRRTTEEVWPGIGAWVTAGALPHPDVWDGQPLCTRSFPE